MCETRLIVNADDFGMSRGISDAIINAHRFGFLTSASLVANMPAAEFALSRARAFPRLAVGAHLNICQGRPLLSAGEVRTLVDAIGTFYPPREMARRLWLWRVAPADIEREFRAQIRWMKDRGVSPSHADSHHHMHIYPTAARAFVRALEAEGVSGIRACRCAAWTTRGANRRPYGGSALRRALVQAYRNGLQRTVFRRFDSPCGRVAIRSCDRASSADVLECWKTALENLPSGTFELACHPGLCESGFSETDTIRERREQELFCLLNRDLRDVIERRHIQLITYRELPFHQRADQPAPAAA